MNCDLLPEVKSSHTIRFLDVANLYQLKQLIKRPTRIINTTETLLDVVLTNKQERIVDSGVIHLGISDHSFVYACRKVAIAKNRPKIVESRSFKTSIRDHFKADI